MFRKKTKKKNRTGVFTTDIISLLLPDNRQCFCILLLPYDHLLLRPVQGQALCGQAKITKWLRPKMASLMSRKPCLVLFLWGSPTLSAYMSWFISVGLRSHEKSQQRLLPLGTPVKLKGGGMYNAIYLS